MEQILGFVEQLLSYLHEDEAAGIINIIKESDIVNVVINFFKGLIG